LDRVLKPDDTQASLRSLSGRVCPRCRRHFPDAGDEDSVALLPRCPDDGSALVAPADLAEADGDPFLGATIASRFVVLARLGAGSMGTVYRARHEAMARDVAVKILRSDRAFDAQAKARFQREARAMSLLSSVHTVTVFDFGEIPSTDDELNGGTSLYLAMELLEGESLGQRLKRRGRLPTNEAVRFARHALLSLAEAHEKGVIHRDLKPDNLFLALSAEGEMCKLLDFGIAKVVDGVARVDALETQAGTVFGTPRYMSPEQAQGKPLDARSDLYSLGVLLYQMLVGRAPFVDDDAVVVMARHIKSTAVSPLEAAPEANIPSEVAAVVMRTLAKDPNDRPSSARDLIDALDRAVQRSPSKPDTGRPPATASGEIAAVSRDDLDARAPSIVGSVPPRRGRSWVAAMVGFAALLVVALFAIEGLRSRSRPTSADGAGVITTVAAGSGAPPLPMPSTAPDEDSSAQAAIEDAGAATPSASSSAGASPSSSARLPLVPRKPPKKYTRFE
jgi:serine/threonine-protein kinase